MEYINSRLQLFNDANKNRTMIGRDPQWH